MVSWCCSIIASYYSMRGGISIDDLYCGIFCNSIGNYYGRSGWSVGTALSLVHIMLFVVEILEIMITVVHSIFMLTVLILILIWALALLYHLNFISIYNYIL